ncbi:PREDICTED: uncharacterized protein LOC109236277 [Nicotiana attenuata]|uniref:PWWP domain-containing protein n=1 Tax=Nicotiana attenuata TaxID=49451 RepID=A0A1J6I7I7_NICAT|nr:PREDICTED: uncharacterized protein LOC109236277 [Nicotiana attenuata]OIS96495.1 uncharacterized protein A4A49_21988 [Nicotiana attenuata]
MGKKTCSAGSIVWVQRKNGTWWPGKILCKMEISTTRIFSPNSFSSRFPIKLLGRDNASVYWYNLEKSSRVKAFRCGEFDDCIKKAESSKVFTFNKKLKYALREDAILHALQLEKQQQEKLKMPDGQSVERAKRNRPFLEQSVHSQSSKSETTASAGYYTLRPKKMISRPAVNKRKMHIQHCRSRLVVSTNETGIESRGVNHKSRPSPGNCLSEEASSQSLSSKFTTCTRKTLIDVDMTVQGTYRGEHTPLVSLMSRLNGKAIVGHPINIEVLDDSSEIILVKKGSSDQLKNKRRMPQLVWRTSKRTPVCYTTSSASKKPNMSNNGPTTFFRGDGQKCNHDAGDKNAVKDDMTLPYVTCVPVKDIFTKLIGALGNV